MPHVALAICVEIMATSSTGQKFPEGVLAILEGLYGGGMTGWGIDHASDIEAAVSSTGLTLSQVKV